MKNFMFLVFAIFLFFNCKTTYNNKAEAPLKGNWTLTDVSYSQSGINVKSFGLADAQCFENSVWKFVPNNHTGNFQTLSSDKCSPYTVNITWYIDNNNQFNMKFIGADAKSKSVKEGYILDYTNATENAFDLVQNASLDGELVQIKYHFTKNN